MPTMERRRALVEAACTGSEILSLVDGGGPQEAVWEARRRCSDVRRATTEMRRRARWKRSNLSPKVGDLSVCRALGCR
ncbi:hypothetical protein U1Q18_038611 [Sarracenia purpurea var. burkii]